MNCLEVRSIEPGSALLGFEEILMFHNLLEAINVCNICCSWEEGSHTDFSHVVRCLWMHCLKVRSIEPGSAIDCPPCDPDDPRQRFGRRIHAILTSKKSCWYFVMIHAILISKKSCWYFVIIHAVHVLFRWQLNGHGGEGGTLVVEAFPKLCLVAGQDIIEVNFHIFHICQDFASLIEILHFPSIRQGLLLWGNSMWRSAW